MKLTAAQIRCLLAVYALSGEKDGVASKRVADMLGVSGPSVHRVLGTLAEMKLLSKAHYGTASLTDTGLAIAQKLRARRDELSALFESRFGLAPGEALSAALLLMGGLEEESLLRLQGVQAEGC